MKEFVDKLIERLKDETYVWDDAYRNGIKSAIHIVNKLAEEYEPCTKSCTDCETYDLVKHHCPKFCKVIKETVEEIEKEYTNDWIACSERLPEKYGKYLCCDKYGEYIIGYPTARVSSDDYYVETEYEIMNDCIAWQPLPQPYKKVGENNA